MPDYYVGPARHPAASSASSIHALTEMGRATQALLDATAALEGRLSEFHHAAPPIPTLEARLSELSRAAAAAVSQALAAPVAETVVAVPAAGPVVVTQTIVKNSKKHVALVKKKKAARQKDYHLATYLDTPPFVRGFKPVHKDAFYCVDISNIYIRAKFTQHSTKYETVEDAEHERDRLIRQAKCRVIKNPEGTKRRWAIVPLE